MVYLDCISTPIHPRIWLENRHPTWSYVCQCMFPKLHTRFVLCSISMFLTNWSLVNTIAWLSIQKWTHTYINWYLHFVTIVINSKQSQDFPITTFPLMSNSRSFSLFLRLKLHKSKSCLVWSCLVLSCLVLSCLLSCLVLSCLVLSCLVLSCLV